MDELEELRGGVVGESPSEEVTFKLNLGLRKPVP